MAQLWASEDREELVYFRTDYRIAWLTVFYAGQPDQIGTDWDPWERAFRQILGLSPAKLIPFFMARAFADQHFPTKFLPCRYTRVWREDFERCLEILGLPAQNLIPEFIASAEKQRAVEVRPTLPPKKPSVGTGPDVQADRKGVA
jgi:hypothetical protein